jgi:hypothetical protein
VNDVTWFNLWTYTIESETIRNVWLCPFGSLAKNPLANIGWTFTNRKRYPVLLTYTVEQTLLGNAGDLKETAQRVKGY